jgi:hypothetical protein
MEVNMDAHKRAALENRYDGPIPVGAAVSHDAGEPWEVQLATRRDLAWLSVRRRGHDIVRARRLWNQFHDVRMEKLIRRLRLNLKRELRVWRQYRDWVES